MALVTLCTPTALWRRGKFEPKDARGRVAVADVFGHAAGFEVSPGAVSVGSRGSSETPRAGFCGVLGCVTHDARRGKRGGLAASLEKLNPPVPSPRPIQPARADAPCAADAGEDAIAVIAGFLDARSAACLAATCGGMRDRMDCHASGLSKTINLHPHQRAGLAWMRKRERPGRDGFALRRAGPREDGHRARARVGKAGRARVSPPRVQSQAVFRDRRVVLRGRAEAGGRRARRRGRDKDDERDAGRRRPGRAKFFARIRSERVRASE